MSQTFPDGMDNRDIDNLVRFLTRLNRHENERGSNTFIILHRGDSCGNTESSEERTKRFMRPVRHPVYPS
jgi:hypothetical protein